MERMQRRVFTKEFKLEAVKLVKEQGYSKLKAAKSLGVAEKSLLLWVKQFEAGILMSMPGPLKRAPEAEELLRLRRELQEVRMERDLLKKAAAYFAKHAK